MAAVGTDPIYLFDLYGVMDLLKNGGNKARDAFAEGMTNGTIKVMKSVSTQLKDMDEGLYKDFQSLKSGRVYQPTSAKHSSVQQMLMDKYGTGWFGGSPTSDHFESVAVCRVEKLKLVTGGKAHTKCTDVKDKCNLSKFEVLTVSEFAAAA